MDADTLLRNDVLLGTLHYRLGIPRWIIGPLLHVLVLVQVPWAVLTGVWATGDSQLRDNYHWWIGYFILTLLVYLALRYYRRVPEVFDSMGERGIFTDGTAAYKNTLQDYARLYARPYFNIISILVAAAVAAGMHLLPLDAGRVTWATTASGTFLNALGFWKMFLDFLLILMIGQITYAVVVTIVIYYRLDRDIHAGRLGYEFVRLSQSNAGGLKPLGELAMNANYTIVIVGLFVGMMSFTVLLDIRGAGSMAADQAVQVFVPLALYGLLAPTLFFFHLWPIHQIMREKKDALFRMIQNEDRQILRMERESLASLYEDRDRMDDLAFNAEVFNMVKRLPSWPFNVETILKLVTTVMIPLLPFLVEFLI